MKLGMILIAAFQYFVLAFTSLFPMVNPFSAIPLFLALTAEMTNQERRRQGTRACWNSAIIMSVALFLGSAILEFFGISIGSLRVAGGLIVAYLGFGMLFPTAERSVDVKTAADHGFQDYSFIPLALPSLSGAGTLAVIIGFSTQIAERHTLIEKGVGYLICLLAILLVALLSVIVLRASEQINRVLGTKGLEVLSRIMGLIMICIGVQFVTGGIKLLIQTP